MGTPIRIAAAATLLAATMTAVPAEAAQAAQPAPPPPVSLHLPPILAAVAKRALDALSGHLKDVRGGEGQTFQARDVIVDGDGTTHTRMDRTYLGLPVLGGDTVVHQKPGDAWDGASLTMADPPAMKIIPVIPAAVAEITAKLVGLVTRGAPKLVIESRTLDNKPRLAWQIRRTGKQPDGAPSDKYITVDALTGKILEQEETIQTAEGTGQSYYSGTVSIETTPSGGGFELKNPNLIGPAGGSYTIDVAGQEDIENQPPATGPTYTDADNKWGDGTLNNPQTLPVDAQYGAEIAYSYYKDVHNRDGIGNDGKGTLSRTNYGSPTGDWSNNAFFPMDSEGTCFCISYGSGNRPMYSVDFAGHEMSHGVTAKTARLTYNSGDQGGLNEATSDIFGTMIEYYANNPNDPADYLLGERIQNKAGFPAGAPDEALRYMDHPSKDKTHRVLWPKGVYSSFDYWQEGGFTGPGRNDPNKYDPHLTSGVANHFFYLLSEGSGKKTINGVNYDSPTYDGSTVQGIGNYDAALIWFRALNVYLTSNAHYPRAATCTLQAAADLFDEGSTQYNAVKAAWAAVNVPQHPAACKARTS